jgi:hypothetical protein
MGMGGQIHIPAALPLGKPGKETRYSWYKRLGGPQGWSVQVWKISSPPGFDLRTVHPVVSHCTSYVIPGSCNYDYWK